MLNPAVKDRVIEKIDEQESGIIKFLQDLVKVPSISGEEGRAQDVVAERFRDVSNLKLDVWEPDLHELMKYPLYPLRSKPWSYKDRPNVVGVIDGGSNGRSLILNGHIDVVSAEPVAAWSHPPWSGMIESGRLYGRGAVDMKGGLAAMTYAAKCIIDAGIRVKGRLILESVVEEEYGGGGTIATLVRDYKAAAAIVTEGTGAQGICMGAGGSRFFTVNTLGKSEVAHLGHLGVNAIFLGSKLCHALSDLNEQRVKRLQGKHPLFEKKEIKSQLGTGRPTSLTLGIMRAGDWPSTVAGWVEIQGRVGFPPSERGDDVVKEIEETIIKTAQADPWMKDHQPIVQWWGPRKEGYVLDSNEPLVQTIKHYTDEITEKNCDLYATPTNSDANYLAAKVGQYGGIPTIMYGPGGGNLHGADEYVLIDEVITATKVLALTILEWCGYES